MATLAEFRTKYPQYNDMPDVELADSLHQKFYSDIPRPQFFQQLDIVGLQLPGSEKTISLPKAQPSIMDRLGAVLEVPATMATGVGIKRSSRALWPVQRHHQRQDGNTRRCANRPA